MPISRTAIDQILADPGTRLVPSEEKSLRDHYEFSGGTIVLERIVEDGAPRRVEKRLFDPEENLVAVETVHLASGKLTSEDATSYEHRKAQEEASGRKKAISQRVRAWAKENREKQQKLDQLGQNISRLQNLIIDRQAELEAARAEYSALMNEKREFLLKAEGNAAHELD